MNHLWPWMNQRRVGARDFGLGHREAGSGDPFAQRPEVLVDLIRRRPVVQRVHVAFVRSRRVKRKRTEARLRGFGGNRRHLDVGQAHAAVFLGHVRQPESPLLRGCAHGHDLPNKHTAIFLMRRDLGFGRLDNLVQELAHLRQDEFEFFGETEIDRHEVSAGRDGDRRAAIGVLEGELGRRAPSQARRPRVARPGCCIRKQRQTLALPERSAPAVRGPPRSTRLVASAASPPPGSPPRGETPPCPNSLPDPSDAPATPVRA
jgi:hypothetical protein